MSLKLTIEKAAEVAGSQKALAELIGETPQHISGFKNGTRICGIKKRAQIAEIAGESVMRAILEGVCDSLSDDVQREAGAKAAFRAMLDAFPPETDENPAVVARRWRKR